jgi:hypothetical protein
MCHLAVHWVGPEALQDHARVRTWANAEEIDVARASGFERQVWTRSRNVTSIPPPPRPKCRRLRRAPEAAGV